MKTALNYLFQISPPWIDIGPGEIERAKWNPSLFYSHPGASVCVRQFRGQKMRTVPDLMNEFGAALQFFEGFGENWDALEECLRYLDEWLPADAYVLVIERAEELLVQEPTIQMSALLKTLHIVGEWWSMPIEDNGQFSRSAKPFHTLLNFSKSDPVLINKFVKIAADAQVPVRQKS